MVEEQKNCAFQYYDGYKVKVDVTDITLTEAKKLFNDNYDDMVHKAKDQNIEVAIWINMRNNSDYGETLIHICSPISEKGVLKEVQTVYFNKFKDI